MKLEAAKKQIEPNQELKYLATVPPAILYLFDKGAGLHIDIAAELKIGAQCVGGYCKLENDKLVHTDVPTTAIAPGSQRDLDIASQTDIQFYEPPLD